MGTEAEEIVNYVTN